MRALDEKKIRLDDPVDKKQRVAKAIAMGVISSTETNASVKIAAGELVCMDYWRRMANSIQGWREEVRINRKKASEQAAVMSQIFEGSKKDLKESSPLSDQASNALHDVSTNFAALGASQDHASVTANALSLELALKDPRTPDRNKAVGLKKAGEILGFLTRAADCQLLEQALENRSPTILAASGVTPVHFEQLKLDYNSAVRSARDVAEARYRESGPFDQTLDIMVNADSRPLAFSQDADLQRKLSEVGYLWRETCRPMTFQAVLNSLIFNHEKAPGSRTYAILESLAKVAGGLVGLGTVANEFSSRSYLASVNLYSTIVLPELQKQLMDDLKKLIRNLGEMGMDNIMSIPPNDVVDRYVFFPKGPIYNHVDEFNVSDPAYIVRIDSDDAGVEATLIDQDVVVHGGSADAGRLVERALNEGRAEQNAEMMKQIELKERLRRLELATMITQVETALLGTRCPTNAEPKPNDRIIKEGQVRKLVADHEVRFGKDSSGLIASLMAKNCIDYYDSAPTVTTSAIQKVEVLAGGETMPLLLPVSDAQTPASRLQITPTAESPDRINVGKIKITRPGLTSTGTNSEDGPITVVIPTEPNLPVIQSVETSISFAVKDEGGNSVTARIPITLQPADLQLQSETEGVKPESSGSGFKLEGNNLNQILTFNYKLFIYQANSENWKVSVTNTANDNIDVSLEELPLTIEAGGKGVLSGRIRVDPSVCCPGTNSVLSQSRIVVRWNTNAIVEKTLKLRLQPK